MRNSNSPFPTHRPSNLLARRFSLDDCAMGSELNSLEFSLSPQTNPYPAPTPSYGMGPRFHPSSPAELASPLADHRGRQLSRHGEPLRRRPRSGLRFRPPKSRNRGYSDIQVTLAAIGSWVRSRRSLWIRACWAGTARTRPGRAACSSRCREPTRRCPRSIAAPRCTRTREPIRYGWTCICRGA